MNVYWLEQTEVDVRSEDDWLHASELVRLRAMRVPKRRTDWRLGRWTAKLAFAAYLDLPAHSRFLMDMEIRPAETGAPELYFADKPADASISISHCGGRAICAIAASGIELGCDLERIEPRTDAFIADYFTDAEKAVIARTSAANNPRMLALLWSAKESALKVLQTGLRADTRSVMVNPGNILFSDDENCALSMCAVTLVGLSKAGGNTTRRSSGRWSHPRPPRRRSFLPPLTRALVGPVGFEPTTNGL